MIFLSLLSSKYPLHDFAQFDADPAFKRNSFLSAFSSKMFSCHISHTSMKIVIKRSRLTMIQRCMNSTKSHLIHSIIIWLKPFLFKEAIAFAWSSRVLCSAPCQSVRHAPQGWTSVPVPDGWLQVIRGPRPSSVKWTKAQPTIPSGRRAEQVRRPQPVPRAPVDPDTVMSNARVRVTKLEATMAAIGESDPAYPALQDALKTAGVKRN